MYHCVTCTVSNSTGALNGLFPKMRGMPTERTLINGAIVVTVKRHPKVLELINSMRRFATQELDSVLITQPVGPLDGIVHMPIPVVLAHVTQRCTDTTLGGNSV